MNSQQELIPMRAGDMLRQIREQKKLGIAEAAEGSRLRPAVIEAIESGDTSTIPNVYLRGHVRAYARFLGVDAAEIERRLDDVRGSDPAVQAVFPGQAARRGGERWLKFSSYVAASALLATLTWQFTHEAVKWSQGDATPREPTLAAPGPSEGTAPANLRNRPLSASIASVEVFAERGRPTGGEAAEQAWAGIDPSALDEPAVDALRTLAVTTSADSWIEIYGAGDRRLEMDLVRAGTTRQYSDEGPFRVMLGRAGAVLLALDGEAVDLAPHTQDGVARLTLPAEPPTEEGQEAPETN